MRSRNQYLQTFPRCQLWFNHQSNGRDSFIHKITFSRGKYVRRILLDEARILSEINVALPHNLLTLLYTALISKQCFQWLHCYEGLLPKKKKNMPFLVMFTVLVCLGKWQITTMHVAHVVGCCWKPSHIYMVQKDEVIFSISVIFCS